MNAQAVAAVLLPVVLGIVMISFQPASALQCWQCVGCMINGTATQGKLISCPSSSTNCYIIQSNGMEFSDCADSCQSGQSGDANWYRCCSGDGCNGAETLAASIGLITIVSLFVLARRWRSYLVLAIGPATPSPPARKSVLHSLRLNLWKTRVFVVSSSSSSSSSSSFKKQNKTKQNKANRAWTILPISYLSRSIFLYLFLAT